jgi:hypothetical protein
MTVGNCATGDPRYLHPSGFAIFSERRIGYAAFGGTGMERSDICNMAVPLKTHRHENTHRQERQGVIVERETERYQSAAALPQRD